jgi:hypothetical protein
VEAARAAMARDAKGSVVGGREEAVGDLPCVTTSGSARMIHPAAELGKGLVKKKGLRKFLSRRFKMTVSGKVVRNREMISRLHGVQKLMIPMVLLKLHKRQVTSNIATMSNHLILLIRGL